MKRWQLKPHHRGKRGGVTVAVTGKEAGRPTVARIQETLRGDEVIEGDHWERFAGRGRLAWLMPAREKVQSSAPEPAVSRQEERLGIKPNPLAEGDLEVPLRGATKDHIVLDEVQPSMVQPPEAPSKPVEPPVEPPPVVAPPEPTTPPVASDEGGEEEPSVDHDDHTREELETIAYARKVKGPEGEDPSDAPNKPTLAAWINGDEPEAAAPPPKRRRRKK